ncbi:universal stress protein, partial [Lactobacillus sp. XV13L]|nr:universal stress protein [Lactobacillus sp. XV13L]
FDFECTLAQAAQGRLGIVTVVESRDINVFESLTPGTMEDKRLEASHDLLTYVKKAQEFGVQNVKPILTEGTPNKAILEEVVPDFKPDLIVVGSETKKVLGKTIGSQAEGIIEKSPVSVIVVR